MNKLFGISLEDWYWSLKFGRPKKRISLYDLRTMPLQKLPAPVFFLSTGRCGTKWFSTLFEKNPELMVLHEPIPNMAVQGKKVYEILRNTNFTLQSSMNQLITELFWTGREQFIRYSCKSEKRLIETNNSISFFAPVIADIIPHAKFVHLYRHPGEYVRSAVRREHYSLGNSENIKRLEPIEGDSHFRIWGMMSQLQKSAWLWNETNEFIEKFKNEVDKKRIYTFNFNKLGFGEVQDLLTFLEITMPDNLIKSHLGRKENVQSTGEFPKYAQWTDGQKKQLIAICGTLADKYGYNLS